MDVKISLSDIDGVAEVELSNADDEGKVWITLRDQQEMVVLVSIEEVKHALRKLSAK